MRTLLILVMAAWIAALNAHAQPCDGQWLPGGGVPSMSRSPVTAS